MSEYGKPTISSRPCKPNSHLRTLHTSGEWDQQWEGSGLRRKHSRWKRWPDGILRGKHLGHNLSEPEPTRHSKTASMGNMLEEPHEMVHNAIQQNTQLCVQDAELMEANREYLRTLIQPKTMKTKLFDMTHPDWCCGTAKELDNFLITLPSNFQLHTYLFPDRDPDTVNYAVSLLCTWNTHPYPVQKQTQMANPV